MKNDLSQPHVHKHVADEAIGNGKYAVNSPPFIKVWWPHLQALCSNCGGRGTIPQAYTLDVLPLCHICNGDGVVRIAY